MLKLNFRSLFLIIGVIILIFIPVGCVPVNDAPPNNDDIQNKDEQPPCIDETGELSVRFLTTMAGPGDETVSFYAEHYIQSPPLSWVYSPEIRVDDGQIYIHDFLYEQVSSSAPPAVVYSEGFLNNAAFYDSQNGNQEISDTLQRIKESEFCYVLKTDEVCNTGKEIFVYEIDNAFYFVRFFESGEVMRIHRAIIE